jgi:Pectate lyase superfamily protein
MPLPDGITTITVTGTYGTLAGSPALTRRSPVAQVTFAPSVLLTDSNGKVIFTTDPVCAPLNVSGEFSVTLPCTDNEALNPAGWVWNVTEEVPSAGRSYSVFLPSTLGGTVDISDLSPVASVTPASSYVLTSQVGEPSGVASLDSTGHVPAGQIPSLSGDYLPSAGGSVSGTIDLGGSPPLKLPSGTSGDVLTSDGSGNLTLQSPGEPVLTASGDTSGATDQAAITAAEGTGRIVYFGPGTFWVTGLTKQTGTIWQGAGRLETVIKLTAGSDADVIQGAGFASLTLSGNNTGGISGWGIRDLSIDGNHSAQSGTSYGLRVYGFEFDLKNVSIRNCLSWGLYTEWGTYGQPGSDSSMEARYEGLEIHGNQQGGWHDRGPHDSRSWGCTIWGNGAGYPNYWAESADVTATVTSASNGTDVSTFTTGSPGTLHVSTTLGSPAASLSTTQGAITVATVIGGATLTYTGTTAQSFTGCVAHGASSGSTVSTGADVTAAGVYSADGNTHNGIHAYGPDASWQYQLDAAVTLDAPAAEVAATGMVLIRGWGCQILGGDLFVTGSATGCGIQLGDSVNAVSVTQVSALVRQLANTSSSTASLNIANDYGSNEVRLAVYAPSGTDVVTGTPSTGSAYRVAAFGQSSSQNTANSLWNEPGSLSLSGSLAAGGGAAFGGTVAVTNASALFQAVNTGTAQYQGSGVTLYSEASTLGTQGGVNVYAGIADTGATEGFVTFDQVDHTGSYVGHLLYFDLSAQTASLYFPLTLPAPLAISSGGTGTSTGAAQNDVFAGPATGGAGAPSFRSLAAADLPGPGDWINAVTRYGADNSGGSDTTARLQNALSAAASGQVVYLPAGTYVTSAPLAIPQGVTLLGASGGWAEPSGNYGITGTGGLEGMPVTGTIIAPSASFTPTSGNGAAVIFLTTGDAQGGQQQIRQISIDGQNSPSGNAIHGIQLYNAVGGVKMRDVLVYGGTGDNLGGNGLDMRPGANSNPDFHDIAHCKFSAMGGYGVNMNGVADSYFVSVEATGNAGANWSITNCNNCRYTGCKGENSASGQGWYLTAASGFTGALAFSGCTSQFNHLDGWYLTGPGAGLYQFTGCRSVSDGESSGNAFTITGSFAGTAELTGWGSVPGPAYPADGLKIESVSSSAYVLAANCLFWGYSTAVSSDSSAGAFLQDANTVYRTGPASSPSSAAQALAAGQGGTGQTSLTANEVLLGNGTSAVATVSGTGLAGQVLTAPGSGGAPAWADSPAGFSNPMSGAGDIVSGGSGGAAQATHLGTAGQVLTATRASGTLELAWANAPVDWVNAVTMFGADPTGSTDSAAAIQKAIYTSAGLRPDTVTMTASSTTVNDTSAVSGDAGLYVFSPNFPAGMAQISTVSAGSHYTVSVAATASETGVIAGIGSLTEAGTGPVYLPAGTYFITSPLALAPGTVMTGASGGGYGGEDGFPPGVTEILLYEGSNCSMIVASPAANYWRLSDLLLSANATAQTGPAQTGATGAAIHVADASSGAELQAVMERVYVEASYNDALYLGVNRRSLHARDCKFIDAGLDGSTVYGMGNAVSVNYSDHEFSDCIIGNANHHGFNIMPDNASMIRITGCDIFTNGQDWATFAPMTVASGSNGQAVSGLTAAGVLHVSSIPSSPRAFPASGSLMIVVDTGNVIVSYTGTSGGNEFTGVTVSATAGNQGGSLATSQAVYLLGGDAIHLGTQCSSVKISGCSMDRNQGCGLFAETAVQGIGVSSNRFLANSAVANGLLPHINLVSPNGQVSLAGNAMEWETGAGYPNYCSWFVGLNGAGMWLDTANAWEYEYLTTESYTNYPAGIIPASTGGALQQASYALGSSGTAVTVNPPSGRVQTVTLTANCTFTFAAPYAGAWPFTLIITQGGSGTPAYLASWTGGGMTVKWPGGTAPTLSTAAGDTDIIDFLTPDGGTTWYGTVSGLNYH